MSTEVNANQESGKTDDAVAEALANELKQHMNNGSNNGSNNGQEQHQAQGSGTPGQEHQAQGSGTPGEEKTGARGSFDMWDDIARETEQDKNRSQNPGGSAHEHFDFHSPDNDVTDEELKNENMTLKEANATVSLYMAALDLFTSLTCCVIRDDFSLTAQLKYRIHPWRKKAIQIPWVRLVMLPGKKRKPGWALAGAILAGTVPTIGLALIDNWHEYKRSKDPNYAQKADQFEQSQQRYQKRPYQDPRAQENPGYQKMDDAEFVPYVEITDDDGNNGNDGDDANNKKGKPGRHAKTCPRHLDPQNGKCNCK